MRDHVDPELGPVRRCRVCGEDWPLDQTFYSGVGGGYYRVDCRACRAEGKQPTTEQQRAAERERRRRYFATHPEVYARQREKSDRYYQAHREVARERRRARYWAAKAAAQVPA